MKNGWLSLRCAVAMTALNHHEKSEGKVGLPGACQCGRRKEGWQKIEGNYGPVCACGTEGGESWKVLQK